jgi:UDP-N-acetylglucosamine--N-acetylmuramyl-(pentapeptide) pyrophosphoryl-undecaprenol N-acetylglucosamine transferase
LVGNPVRSDIAALSDPGKRLASHDGQLRVLVLGGSQGARVLNEIVPAAVALLPEDRRPDIWHQTGAATSEIASQAYANAGVIARLDEFIDDVAGAYEWADMVICRAGALTISELAVAGLGAILVPYPSAADDHQTGNAEYLVAAGAAVLIPQSGLTPESLADELKACAADRRVVIDRAVSARSLAKPNATRDVVERCLAMADAK